MNLDLILSHPKPEQGRPLALQALLKITGEAASCPRAPLSLALVLDRSGSMSGAKLSHVRDAAALLVRRLWPDDAVSVVVYDSDVDTLAAGARGAGAHQEAIRQIEGIQCGDTTNLSGGWLRGRELVEEFKAMSGVNRIILMTDGLANEGITDPSRLRELCRTAAQSGISTTTIGVGGGFNEDLLQDMAAAGDGASYYIENPDQAPGIFEEEIEGLLSLTAQNVSVELRPGAGTQLAAIRHAYRTTHAGDCTHLDIGDLYAMEPRLVLMDFLLQRADPHTELEVAQIRVQGDFLTEAGGVERRSVDLPIRLTLADGPRVEPELERVAVLLEASVARQRALDLQARGRYDDAAHVMELMASVLDRQGPNDLEAAEEAGDLRVSASQLRDGLWAMEDVKYLKQQIFDDERGRRRAKERYRRE